MRLSCHMYGIILHQQRLVHPFQPQDQDGEKTGERQQVGSNIYQTRNRRGKSSQKKQGRVVT